MIRNVHIDAGKDKLLHCRHLITIPEFYTGLPFTQIYDMCLRASKPTKEERDALKSIKRSLCTP